MVFRLNSHNHNFPDPALAEPGGLLAIGGDLDPQRIIKAYQSGIFPWYSEGEPVLWYAPHERCVIFPGKVLVNKSMQKIIRMQTFTIKTDTAFTTVIANCKNIKRKDQQGTWITDEMEQAYIKLHGIGIAHSIEAWKDGELAAGMYGLEINNVFCGESMYSKISNASKAIQVWISQESNYRLLDCQVPNDHLIRMGATMISQKEYLKILQAPL